MIDHQVTPVVTDARGEKSEKKDDENTVNADASRERQVESSPRAVTGYSLCSFFSLNLLQVALHVVSSLGTKRETIVTVKRRGGEAR